MTGRFRQQQLEGIQRDLLAKLGMSPAEIEETLNTPPPVPSEEQVRALVNALTTPESFDQAWRDLKSESVRELATPFLKEVAFSRELEQASDTTNAQAHVIKLLCSNSPEFIAENIQRCLALADQNVVEDCLSSAFSIPFENGKELFQSIVEHKKPAQAIAALYGLRKRAWQNEITEAELKSLFPVCLQVCHPDFPLREGPTTADPVMPFAQVFGPLAIESLSVAPYLSADNPHLEDIVSCFPEAVLGASPEIVSELLHAFRDPQETQQIYVCQRLLPLAALKLQASCKATVEALADHPNTGIRTAATHARATIACGRDPLADAGSKQNWDELTRDERAFLLTRAFDGEVRNGGVRQFLSNDHFNRAEQTLEGLELLGADSGHKLLETAIRAVQSTTTYQATPHFQQCIRGGGEKEIPQATWDEIRKLEDLYYEREKKCDLLIFEYILANCDRFR